MLDRFGQIEPALFIACDGYWYNGKQNDVSAKVKAVMERLPSVRSAYIVDYLAHCREGGVRHSAAPSRSTPRSRLSSPPS